jgi:hypothetical protein
MLGSREKGAIKVTHERVEAMNLRLQALIEDMQVLTQMVRDIKRSVVRKYGKDENGKS